MKVLITSTSYPNNASDWRGQFIRHLIFALSKHSDVQLSLWAPPGEIPESVTYCATHAEEKWLKNLSNRGGIANLLRNRPITGTINAVNLLRKLGRVYRRNDNVDLIHVNWLQNALPLGKSTKPLVISVLGSDFHLLRLPGMISTLRRVFRNKNCIICPNASWMRQPLDEYFGDVAEIIHIPYGIDHRLFSLNAYRHQSVVRRWLAIIRVTRNKVGPLFDWGESVFDELNELHLLGPMQQKIEIPTWCHYNGPTNPQQLIKQWLPSATGLVTLSQHAEGLPQIILEAMAAGVPVIASDIPAHKSVIKHQDTGWLVTSRQSFQQGIDWLSDPDNRQRVAENAKHWVMKNVGTWQDCANRFIDIYRRALE